ncbi:MAG TPA: CoA transferase [Saprospiraceae bacterium]|nr:CoA transferase [Saprospiraceae bacterium]
MHYPKFNQLLVQNTKQLLIFNTSNSVRQSFFSGLKVVELASVLAGPAVGMFFAELGAEVVKIENRSTGGDVTRGWKQPAEDPRSPVSAYWSSVNWGKTHLLLNLDEPADHAQALHLIAHADVLISNFKPSSARRMGVDADTLRARHPRLIFAQINSFADPEDESPAFDMVLQAEAGFLHMCGEPERPPVRMPVALIDVLAAHQLKEAVLLGVLHRERTGEGSTVSISLMEAALASLVNQASNYLMTGQVPQRMGTRHPNIAPYGDVFTCADGQSLLLAAGTERQFRQLCLLLDLPQLAEHPDFQRNTDRVAHRDALCAHIAAVIGTQPLEHWMQACRTHAVPAARIRDMRAVFERPEAQAMILEEKTPEGVATRRMRTVAFSMQA